mgnify:CR=1 FL=1
MDSTRHLSSEEVLGYLAKKPQQSRGSYLAMYSSWYGGIVTHPGLMLLPVDEHLAHRGDGSSRL